MRTFHTGGVAGGGDITMGLPRVEEIFEARSPGGRAVIAGVEGVVAEITPERRVKIKVHNTTNRKVSTKQKTKTITHKANKIKDEIVEYKIPSGQAILVRVGEEVKAGQQLCEGSIDLQELFRIAGKEETWRYILQEIQRIYVSQGAVIHDKHIEVVVRQMFSRVRVKEAGDSSFVPGQIIEFALAKEENEKLKKAKKKPLTFTPLLFGISKVSLTTDSFLSAASFQETARVLIRAAIEAKEDRLQGLKENVIIGKLIPAGTGFRK
jgi:DNA-directed RNA polymerase subunit beta'